MSANSRRADSRQIMLDRIQAGARSGDDAAQREADYAGLPRPYTHAGKLDAASRIALLIHRLREYDAEVVECAPAEIAGTIAAQIAGSGRRSFVAPPGLAAEWLVANTEINWKMDRGLPAEEIDRADGVLTAAFCAIADSGTIVLHHSATEGQSTNGRRVLTLLPDWHLCVLRASQVVETLPEYFARCPDPPSHPSDEDLSLGTPAPLATWISGPSATADIEMTRIKGVHGPRFLHVILIRDEAK